MVWSAYLNAQLSQVQRRAEGLRFRLFELTAYDKIARLPSRLDRAGRCLFRVLRDGRRRATSTAGWGVCVA